MFPDRIVGRNKRPRVIQGGDENTNQRGLDNVARGTFSGVATNLDAVAHGTPNLAVTVINLTTLDNEPRPFTVTMASPLLGGQVQQGNTSALVEWGSGGFASSFICDAREGEQFCLTCSTLRVSIFNDALAQGYDPTNLIQGVSNPITFGAFVSVGVGVNANSLRRSEVRIFWSTSNDETSRYGLHAGDVSDPFIIPKHAADAKVFVYPQQDYIVYQVNPKGRKNVPSGAFYTQLSTEVLAGNDCPRIILAGDTKQIQVENASTSTDLDLQVIHKMAVVWGLSV